MDPILLAILLFAFGAVLFLFLGCARGLQGPKSLLKSRLHEDRPADGPSAPALTAVQLLRDRRMSDIRSLNKLLEGSPLAAAVALELAQARLPLRVGEYFLMRIACGVAAALLLMTLGGNVLAAIPGGLIGYFGPKMYVSRRRSRRLATIEGQLVDALSLSANSLRAGWGFMQAMSQVAHEMPPPISEEFTQLFQEVSVGASQEMAIHNLVQRVPSYDLELVMTAVLIQRQIGGNLAEMLDNIAFTIRERTRLLADIVSLTAESKMSMWLLSLLPIGLLILMAVTQPDYTFPFLTDPRGRVLLVGAGVMELLGVLIMRRMSDIKA